jgi:medium-chain acyl-[acyl-carrier-protein] hydrolase
MTDRDTPGFYRATFEIYFHDADRTGFATLPAVCRYLQAAAIKHGRSAGTSFDHVASRNLAWVYSRFHIQMQAFPRYGETIVVGTWRSGVEGTFAFREYAVRDSEDNPLGAATASSALIDKSTRKPVAVPDDIRNMVSSEPGHAVAAPFAKLPAMTDAEYRRVFPVRTSDIDINGHVNNISYLDWIIEGVPEEVLLDMRPYEAAVEFRAEAFYGQSVVSEASRFDGGAEKAFMHRLSVDGDGRVTTRARTAWR